MKNARKPNAFLIRAAKTATTSIAEYLGGCPDVYVCEPKEPQFFDRGMGFSLGLEWYLGLFDGREEKILIDATTTYTSDLRSGAVCARIEEFAPDSKYLYVIREPVSRCYSLWRQTIRNRIVQKRNWNDLKHFRDVFYSDKTRWLREGSYYASQIKNYHVVWNSGRMKVLIPKSNR